MSQTSLTLTGKVAFVGEVVEVSSTFSKREVWLDVEDGNYSQTVPIEFVQDKTALLNPVKKGMTATIDINIRGNVANTKNGDRCFLSFQGWRIKASGEGNATQKSAPLPTAIDAADPAPQNEDDLPF